MRDGAKPNRPRFGFNSRKILAENRYPLGAIML
jgi:hypothetical protein